MKFLAVVAALIAAASAAPSGKIVYISYTVGTQLKAIDLANNNKINVLLTLPVEQSPTWSESSASDGNSTFFYSFIEETGNNGHLVGFDVNAKKQVFRFETPYFWRIGYDSSTPDGVYGLTLLANNVQLVKVNTTTKKSETLGSLPNGFTQPSNSAVYSNVTKTFYAYLQNAAGTATDVLGISIESGKPTTKAVVNDVYVCEVVLDESTGLYYGVVMDSNNDVYLAKIDPVTGKSTAVGTKKLAASACDAGGALSSWQRLYFAYVKDNNWNSLITIWNMETGELEQNFQIENSVYGMQYFD